MVLVYNLPKGVQQIMGSYHKILVISYHAGHSYNTLSCLLLTSDALSQIDKNVHLDQLCAKTCNLLSIPGDFCLVVNTKQ